MTGRSRRVLAVIAAVEAVREAHAELRAPATGVRMRRVLAAEGIDIVARAVRKSRALVGPDGNAAIILSTRRSTQTQWKRLVHEYGHIKLHFSERGEIVRNIVACRVGDAREDEANLFAALLVLGPDATIEHPTAAAIVAKLTAADHRKRRPEQLALELPEPAPVYRSPSIRYGHGSHNPGAIEDARGRRRRRGPILVPAPHSPYFDWSKDGKPLGWFHPTLGWIWVYDGLFVEREGKRRWEILACGDRRTERRVFVLSPSEKPQYVFREGERRTRTADALTKQFASAIALHGERKINASLGIRSR